MAEQFEFNNKGVQAEDLSIDPLANEGLELLKRNVAASDKGLNESLESDKVVSRESFETALSEVALQLQSIAERIGELPDSFRHSFMESITEMTGDKFPAYDALRLALVGNS